MMNLKNGVYTIFRGVSGYKNSYFPVKEEIICKKMGHYN